METFQKRLERFENGPPVEFVLTLLSSISTYFIPELTIAAEKKLSDLLILGIHSKIETISEKIFLKTGTAGFKFYLENFVDGSSDNLRFSVIAEELNDLRNIIAHQHISKLGHIFGFNYEIEGGFVVNNSLIVLNPLIFFEQFKSSFEYKEKKTKSKIWDYQKLMGESQLEEAKRRFIRQFKIK